jgi:uracil-DNA glycosylase family protein
MTAEPPTQRPDNKGRPPSQAATIADSRAAATHCTACALYRDATQTVFGEGPEGAIVMLICEQPGDAEDLAGHPFVGPAGKLLNRCLAEAGIDRARTYVTNVVKHFKWVLRGTRRIHSKPGSLEIEACFPWLEAEIAAVKPRIIGAGLVWKNIPRDQRSWSLGAVGISAL